MKRTLRGIGILGTLLTGCTGGPTSLDAIGGWDATPAISVAPADARIATPFFQQFPDVNPCSGQLTTVTISGTAWVIEQDGRQVTHSERTISTSDGFQGRGTGTDVFNGHNEMIRLSDMVSDASGARFRAQFLIVLDLTAGTVRVIKGPQLTCLHA